MQTLSSITFEYPKLVQLQYHTGVYMSNNPNSRLSSASPTPVPDAGPALSVSMNSTPSSTDGIHKGQSKAVKPPNVFSNDGSFLDRIRRSMKEEEDKQKGKEALERKKQFADRFKTRGKRSPPTNSPSSTSDATPELDESPKKKLKTEQDGRYDGSARAEYHKALEAYSGSLKDNGTGVRPLVK